VGEIHDAADVTLRINSPVQKDAFSGMNRRRFLKSSMAVAAVCGTSGVASYSQAAFAEDSGIADGQTRRFDYPYCSRWPTIWRASRGAARRAICRHAGQSDPQAYNSIQYDAALAVEY
jgi:glucan biosynthesis protein